jgi:hypothetical protein
LTTKLTSDNAAVVDSEYYWREISSDPPPTGAKVQLINRRAGVAQYGTYSHKDDWYTHWAPLPVFPWK